MDSNYIVLTNALHFKVDATEGAGAGEMLSNVPTVGSGTANSALFLRWDVGRRFIFQGKPPLQEGAAGMAVNLTGSDG